VTATTDRALFAGPIGMLLARFDAKAPAIDFLSPRRPPVKRDSRKRNVVLAGAGAVVVVALLGLAQWQRLNRLDGDIEVLNQAEDSLNRELAQMKPTTDAAALVAEWDDKGVDWLEEIVELTNRMPSTDKVYLERIDFKPRNGTAPPVIHIAGFARTREEGMGLNPRFAADNHFKGLPVKDKGQSPKEVEYYTFTFEKDLRLLPAPVKKSSAGTGAAKKSGEVSPGSGTTPSSAAAGANEAGGRTPS
jgi:hypothetical protein